MNDLELIVDLHLQGERQGPGSDRETLRALDLIQLPEYGELKFADIGCGTGAQTFALAEHTRAEIVAVDIFSEFLSELKKRVETAEFSDQIKTLKSSMDDLPFGEEAFDVIWSEGAIYLMGFAKGIKAWRKYLKPGGYLAVSEIVWTTKERPEELEVYWKDHYPEIGLISEKIKVLEDSGYSPIGHFVLPASCWLDHYYHPMEKRFDVFLDRHDHSKEAKALVASEKEEIKFYKKHKVHFSYGFFVAKKLN